MVDEAVGLRALAAVEAGRLSEAGLILVMGDRRRLVCYTSDSSAVSGARWARLV